MDDLIGVIFVIIVIAILYWVLRRYDKATQRKMTPEGYVIRKEERITEIKRQEDTITWGNLKEQIICPHCQTKGHVRTKMVKQKKGISGAKATGALLTLGTSILFTGLSRKEEVTEAHCGKCGSTWHFA